MASPPRPSSPSQISPAVLLSLKQIQSRLAASKGELSQLDILKLKDALVKFGKLLEFAKRTRGNEDVVVQLVGQAERLHQTTLSPIAEAKRNPTFSISDGLTKGLCDLFKALDAAIPEKSQSSRFNLLFSSIDVGVVVTDASSKIETAMDTFLQQGEIKRTDGYHLVQTRHQSEAGPQAQEPRQTRTTQSTRKVKGGSTSARPGKDRHTNKEAQAAAGPSTANQASELPSQVQQALIACPRFRILLLGKSGAGKSSLINRVFGVTSAEVAHYQAGRAVISQEHTSESNPNFVMHDSMGFESGSPEQYRVVEEFIRERSQRPELSEQIHVIWLCTSIPVSGARVFETGDEQIFQLDLGNVPIVVVFTKYDNLVARAELEDINLEESQTRAMADEYFDGLCVQPLRQICAVDLKQSMPPFKKLSVEKGFEDTLKDLIRTTRDLLPPDARDQVPLDMGFQPRGNPAHPASEPGTHLEHEDDEEPRPHGPPISTVGISFAVAQRADPSIKIDAIIAIGRQRYWKSLASSLDFSGKRLINCITVVHNDIVQVWNFLDPKMCLSSESFKATMSQTVNDLFDTGSATSTAKLAASLSGAAGVTGVLAAMAPPSALVVGPLALTAVLAKWVYDVYQQTPGVLRCLMAYIVDLTIVMRRLFWLMQAKGGIYPVPEHLVKQAVDEYNASDDKAEVHRKIRNFVEQMGVFQRARKDLVVAEVERLILLHRFEPTVPPTM